ncbi:MAG: hypothetical protein WBC91_03345 [Phototrophicaceae bacterium]
MADNPNNETDLQAFLEMAGRSLSDAQSQLGTGTNLKTDFVLANAELEARVGLTARTDGTFAIQPISSADMVKSNINSAAISTVRINFIATGAETNPNEPSSTPKRTKEDVANQIMARPDVARMSEILGPLVIKSNFEPNNQRWVVVAEDQKGRIIREALILDE